MCDKTKMRILPILRTTLLAILTLTFKCSVDLSMIIFNQIPINFTYFLAQNQKFTYIFQIKALYVRLVLGVYIEGRLCLD